MGGEIKQLILSFLEEEVKNDMGKFYLNDLPKEERIKMVAEFYDLINYLKNRKEIRLFFRDLLSPDEIGSLVRRVQVAILLLAGFSYHEVTKTLRVGKDKVANVQKSLSLHGEGYRLAIKRYKKREKIRTEERERIEKAQALSLGQRGYLKAKYPERFLLSYLVDELINWDDVDKDKGVEIIQRAKETKQELEDKKREKKNDKNK